MSLKKFQRTKFRAYVCLGAGQKSMRKYRRCKGRHNKTRQSRKGRPPKVKIGYKREAATSGLIEGKRVVVINKIADLRNLKKNEAAVIGQIGMKKKIGIAAELERQKICVFNLNVRKFLKKIARRARLKEKEKKAEKGKAETAGKEEAEEKQEAKK